MMGSTVVFRAFGMHYTKLDQMNKDEVLRVRLKLEAWAKPKVKVKLCVSPGA